MDPSLLDSSNPKFTSKLICDVIAIPSPLHIVDQLAQINICSTLLVLPAFASATE